MLLSVNFAAEIGILASPGLCLMEVMPHVVTMVSGDSVMKAIIRMWELQMSNVHNCAFVLA